MSCREATQKMAGRPWSKWDRLVQEDFCPSIGPVSQSRDFRLNVGHIGVEEMIRSRSDTAPRHYEKPHGSRRRVSKSGFETTEEAVS